MMKATTWEQISLGSLIMSNANCGSGPSGNQYLVCLCPRVSSQRLRHIWVAAASTSVYKIDLGGSGESGSAPTWSLALAAAVSAATLPLNPECPLTHLSVTSVFNLFVT